MSKQVKNVLTISPMFVLFLVFLVLKATETGIFADWSWWWVTAPLWAPAALAIAIMAVWLVVVIIIGLIALILELLP